MKEYNSVEQLHNEKRKSYLTILYVIITITAIILLFNKCSGNSRIGKSDAKDEAFNNVHWLKVVGNLNFPEGPAWNAENKSLYFSNCYGGWISKIHNSKHDTFLVATSKLLPFEKTNGMTSHNGMLYACDFGKGAILEFSKNGRTNIYAANYNGKRFNNPNDLAFDKKGNLYFTDPKSYGKDKFDGRVFMVKENTKEVVLIKDGLAFPNGIAFTEDGKNLFICESAQNRILRFDVLPDGKIINKNIFIVLEHGDPDGIAFDNKGNLYVAHFGTGHLFVINSQGEIIRKITTPGKKPTNIEFGGKDMKTLYLTEVETNCLYRIKVNDRGIKLN